MSDFGHITDAQIFDAIRAVADAAPETIYRYTVPRHQATTLGRCYYVHTDAESGSPVEAGCLIGKALHALGVPLEALLPMNTRSAAFVMDELNIGSQEARQAATEVQHRQDGRWPWGKAVSMLPETEPAA